MGMSSGVFDLEKNIKRILKSIVTKGIIVIHGEASLS